MIEKEWLARDNLSLVRQLGLDPREVAQREAARSHPGEHLRWLTGGRVAREWTVLDRLALMEQILRQRKDS